MKAMTDNNTGFVSHPTLKEWSLVAGDFRVWVYQESETPPAFRAVLTHGMVAEAQSFKTVEAAQQWAVETAIRKAQDVINKLQSISFGSGELGAASTPLFPGQDKTAPAGGDRAVDTPPRSRF